MSVKGKHSKMFPLTRSAPLTSFYCHKVIALLRGHNCNRAAKGRARGCQKIMGFSGGADQGRSARR